MNGFSKLLTGAAIGALMIGSANAADILGNGSLKDDAPAGGGGVVNWTGFYIGVQGGYGNANHNLSLEEYHGAYCWDQDYTQDQVQPEDPYNPWSYGSGHVDQLNEDGSCGGSPVLGTKTGPYGGGNTKDHGNGVGATTNAWNEDDHATVDGGKRELARLDGVNSRGALGGGRLGFDWARGRLLFGAFAEYNFSNMESNASIAGLGNFSLEKQDEWAVGGRVGYIVAPRTMVYALAAYKQTEYDVKGLDNPVLGLTNVSSGATFDGVAVGGGIEFALMANVFLGLEYQHTFYGKQTLINFGPEAGSNAEAIGHGVRVIDDLDEDAIMATLKIKLNGFGLND